MNLKSFGEWAVQSSLSLDVRPFLINPFKLFTRPAAVSNNIWIQNPAVAQDGNLIMFQPDQDPRTDNGKQEQRQNELEEMTLEEKMGIEKKGYPGADSWAKDEETLFEILYLRQTMPLLPRHWIIDFSGAPMPENVFHPEEEGQPVVKALSRPEFPVTKAIEQLMSLNGDVVTAADSGHLAKTPGIIKKQLTHFLNILAKDGGYYHLKVLPNIFVETVEGLKEDDISEYMQNRMKSLAKLQREFLRVDRSAKFWEETAPALLSAKMEKLRLLDRLLKATKRTFEEALEREAADCDQLMESIEEEEALMEPRKRRRTMSPPPPGSANNEEWPDISARRPIASKTDVQHPKSPVRSEASRMSFDQDGSEAPPIHSYPGRFIEFDKSLQTIKYRRKPPVIYGLFVMGTSVFLLTIDSSKGEDAYVTYHLLLRFLDTDQSVWNALTIAIVACRARDELVERLDDTELKTEKSEADPDA